MTGLQHIIHGHTNGPKKGLKGNPEITRRLTNATSKIDNLHFFIMQESITFLTGCDCDWWSVYHGLCPIARTVFKERAMKKVNSTSDISGHHPKKAL